MAQMGLSDLSDRYASLDAKKDPLVETCAVVPWEGFRPALDRVWRKPMDAVAVFETLVLGALYNLPDDRIEYQVRDRHSFMRFLWLGLKERVPDAKTVWHNPRAAGPGGAGRGAVRPVRRPPGAAGHHRARRADP
jgi:hypothetical protein